MNVGDKGEAAALDVCVLYARCGRVRLDRTLTIQHTGLGRFADVVNYHLIRIPVRNYTSP